MSGPVRPYGGERQRDPERDDFRERLHEIIFLADTPGGKAFDVALLILILVSVVAVMLESIAPVRADYGNALRFAEWGFTIIFTVEYVLRLYCAHRWFKYTTSFFGVVDLVAIVPTYLSLLVSGTQALLVVRVLRLLRVFRVLTLPRFWAEAESLMRALRSSARKISVFLGSVLTLVVIMGATMYLIEGPSHGFTSIPRSMYWAIVTLTTVGYGDISPQTPLGQAVASLVMITGYAIIAVPTGIVSVEMARASRRQPEPCSSCGATGHDEDAKHCKHCGTAL